MADQHNSNIPALANSIASDIPDIKENLEFHKDKFQALFPSWSDTVAATCNPPLLGDATTGRTLRISSFLIEDGTNASTIKCTMSSVFNGDAITATDNCAKGATTGNFTLNAGGTNLDIETSGITGTCVGVAGINIRYANYTSGGAVGYLPPIFVDVYNSSGKIRLNFYEGNDTPLDWTTSIGSASNKIAIIITYITTS